jgi:hypothetical protein
MEQCPETARLHLQGYLYASRKIGGVKVKEYLGDNTAHLEGARGSPIQNRDYCTKQETRVEGPWEEGAIPAGQGSRSDIENAITTINNGGSWADIVENHTAVAIRYPGGIRAVLSHRSTPVEHFRQVSVFVYWGETGTGKTRRAVENCIANNEGYYILRNHGGNSVWFDGYNGEPNLIIDEFYGWIKFGMLLTYLDGYRTVVPVKGSTMWAAWTTVYITSNRPYKEWYNSDRISQAQWGALERRFTDIEEF